MNAEHSIEMSLYPRLAVCVDDFLEDRQAHRSRTDGRRWAQRELARHYEVAKTLEATRLQKTLERVFG